MNKYVVRTNLKPNNSIGLAVSAIEAGHVIELHYLDELLGDDYHDITRSVSVFDDALIDKLCFHDKTRQALFELSSAGDVCFGVMADNQFIEL